MKKRQVRSDLRAVFQAFPLESLRHLRSNAGRLVRGAYSAPSGGCVMYLLSERLPAERRIDSKQALIRHFGGDEFAPEYEPAKWIVRLWDRQLCAEVLRRYGSRPCLSLAILIEALDEAIEPRAAEEAARAELEQTRATRATRAARPLAA